MRRTTITTNPNPSNRGPDHDRDRERWAALGRVLLTILARHQQAAHAAQAASPAPKTLGEDGDAN